VLQNDDPALYLIGKTYRFHPLELAGFLGALEATILENPLQLCVLEAPATAVGYPDLVLRLRPDDIVRVRPKTGQKAENDLPSTWRTGILAKPLVSYSVWTDERGFVVGFDVRAHHILLDGGATGIIEADLARHLAADGHIEIQCVADGLAKLNEAHLHESARVDESSKRLADAVKRELADEARHGGYTQRSPDTPGMAARGILYESAHIGTGAYDAILTLSEAKQIPVNVLVAAASLAVDASLRQSTDGVLVYPVDNRFGNPELHVATCLVNSVAHTSRFSPFASVADVVRALDRGYVKAVRRRWLREEHYRRIYLAVNHTQHVEALALNFLRESCAPALRSFLSEAPIATDIGPVEGMTVASVLDEGQRTLSVAIWHRADLPGPRVPRGVARRIAAALGSMAALWDQPIAMTVDEWFRIEPDGTCRADDGSSQPDRQALSAWFVEPESGVRQFLGRRRYVYPWLAWLVHIGTAPGDVLVFSDDGTDKTIDLVIACHLAGGGYSVCDSIDEVLLRANAIAEHGNDITARVIDVAGARLAEELNGKSRKLLDERIEQVTHDGQLATRTAYIMPTSGSTGRPKLVPISHGSLAVFCAAIRQAYGWESHDTVLQCAPLTSDISVEEIFGAAFCGSTLVRSTATQRGDLLALARDLVGKNATLIDLPTALWHLLCEDRDAVDMIRRSPLRQIVIGGEAVRPTAVDKWVDSFVAPGPSVLSTYGPTETTVVATCLPIVGDGEATLGGRLRLGRPIVPGTVFIAFGEVVIVGDLVSKGYLGLDEHGFGTVITSDGVRRRAFATADRVTFDEHGFPVCAGRKDAIVKVSGKRIDTAEVARRISEDPAVFDVAVELHRGSVGVWFESQPTREGADDTGAAARIRLVLVSLGVSSFFVVGVPSVPRKPNGKVDSNNLRRMPQALDALPSEAEVSGRAAGLAEVWSRHLGRAIEPDASLLGEGIGSLDLIGILPDTRNYLSRNLTVLDLISADTAANLVANLSNAASAAGAWMDSDTTAEIARDFAAVSEQQHPPTAIRAAPSASGLAGRTPRDAIVVVGASGILGTGFARAVLEFRQSGLQVPEVTLATRSTLPEQDPWTALRAVDGVRTERLPADFGADEIDTLLRKTGAGVLVNCIGNTNVLTPYRELRAANVEVVSAIAEACTHLSTQLVHLSTFVVTAQPSAPNVTDPRAAPYPYAASKSLAELALARSPLALDFTIARLPRVLGERYQLDDSADILVSVIDACIALRAYPSVTLTEEVTTGRATAHAILGMLPEFAGSAELGRGITVVRGEAVAYAEFLSGYAPEELDPLEWKYRLDRSDWATENPRRWSVVDAWVSLGMQLGARSYAEYLADYPTVALGVESVAQLDAMPLSLRALLGAPAVLGASSPERQP
jgi:thioester reductase-like protein